MEPDRTMPIGFYRLHWVTGGSSLAAVGQLYDGDRWYAPVNWTSQQPMGIASADWTKVERAELIATSRSRITPEQGKMLLAELTACLLELGIRVDGNVDLKLQRLPALLRATELAGICRLQERTLGDIDPDVMGDLRRFIHDAGLEVSAS